MLQLFYAYLNCIGRSIKLSPPPSSAKVKNKRICTSTSHKPSWPAQKFSFTFLTSVSASYRRVYVNIMITINTSVLSKQKCLRRRRSAVCVLCYIREICARVQTCLLTFMCVWTLWLEPENLEELLHHLRYEMKWRAIGMVR